MESQTKPHLFKHRIWRCVHEKPITVLRREKVWLAEFANPHFGQPVGSGETQIKAFESFTSDLTLCHLRASLIDLEQFFQSIESSKRFAEWKAAREARHQELLAKRRAARKSKKR